MAVAFADLERLVARHLDIPGAAGIVNASSEGAAFVTTKLIGTLKRELAINGEPYTLTLSETGFTLALKGRRKGLDIRWADLVGGDAALATALNASLTANIVPRAKTSKPKQQATRPTRVINRPAVNASNDEEPARPKIEPVPKYAKTKRAAGTPDHELAAKRRGKERPSQPKARRSASSRRR